MPSAVVILASGKILVAGTCRIAPLDWDYAITRLNSDGSPDNNFGTNGKVLTNISSVGDYGQNILMLPNNKFIISGYSGFSPGVDFSMVRYSANGIVDSTFGTNGRVLTDFAGDNDYCFTSALRSDGKIILGGYSRITNGSNIAFARYNGDGSTDNTFDSDGKLNIIIAGSVYSDVTAMLLQPDEKMLFTSNLATGNSVVRCNADGTPDNTFGTGGISSNIIGSGFNHAQAIAFQSDLKIVTAGYFYSGATNDIFVSRYGSGLSVGLNDNMQSENHFTLQPNPANDFTIINQNIFTNAALTLTDISGREIFSDVITNEAYTLQTANLKNGLYFIILEKEGKKVIQKLLVNNL